MIFVCLKFGTKYSAEYVNNLYSALVKRTADYYGMKKGHMDGTGVGVRGRFRLVCYTENAEGLCAGIEVHPLPVEPCDIPFKEPSTIPQSEGNTHTPPIPAHSSMIAAEERYQSALIEGMKGWKGWWYKAYLFHAVESLYTPCTDRHTSSLDHSDTVDSQYCRKEDGIGIGESYGEGNREGDREEDGKEEGEEEDGNKEDDEERSAQCWICYFDLDTVFGGSLDFLFQLLANESLAHSEEEKVEEMESETETETGMKSGTKTQTKKVKEETKKERVKETKFFTLGAAHFPCEGRPCGINSSVMIWQLGSPRWSDRNRGRGREIGMDMDNDIGRDIGRDSNRGSVRDVDMDRVSSSDGSSDGDSSAKMVVTDGVCNGDRVLDRGDPESFEAVFGAATRGPNSFESMFFTLFQHYGAVTQCVYKFDHYLEILLLSSAVHTISPLEHVPSSHSTYKAYSAEGAVRVIYLQDLPGFEGKIIDFSSLFTAPALHVEGERAKNSQENSEATSSFGDTGEDLSLHRGFPTPSPTPAPVLTPAHTPVCDGTLTLNSDPSPVMTSASSFLGRSFCENTDMSINIDRDMDKGMDMDMMRGARVICFPLTPKPHQAAQSSRLIDQLWRGLSA